MKGCRVEKTKAEGRRMGSGREHLAVMLGLKQSQCKYGNSNAFMKCEIKLTCAIYAFTSTWGTIVFCLKNEILLFSNDDLS